jgi:hypothetical protein
VEGAKRFISGVEKHLSSYTSDCTRAAPHAQAFVMHRRVSFHPLRHGNAAGATHVGALRSKSASA